MEEDSESTSQVVPQLVVLLREISVVLLPEETSVVPHQAVLLERLIPSSLEISDSRLRTGLSSSSSSHAVRSAKSELLWARMAEQRASLTFSSLPQMAQRKLWNSMELSSMAVLLDLTSLSRTEVVAAAVVEASAVVAEASAVAVVALVVTKVASAAVVALEATEVASVAVVALAMAEVASVAVLQRWIE